MSEPQSTPDNYFEVRVVEAGDDCNLYAYDPNVPGLWLSGVYRAAQVAVADYAVVPGTSSDGESDIGALLVSHRAIMPGCTVGVRPIALLQIRRGAEQEYRVIAVPATDDTLQAVNTLEDLPEDRRQALVAFVRAGVEGQEDCALIWSDGGRACEVIHQAKQSARVARAKARKSGSATPAWKPLGYRVSGAARATDTEPHTEAEYAYHQLPRRFQKYVDDYLAHTERILFAINRPEMDSTLKRTWFARETLREGILFITDQQVALITEVLPPGQFGINYGYLVHTGIPERIESTRVQSAANRHVCLEVTWRAVGGEQRVVWEFPPEAADELNEVVKILHGWQPFDGDVRVRRAFGPEPVEMELRDPAANDPADTVPIARRLADALEAELPDGESVLARALLPAWADSRQVARIFAVTNRRAILLPDPADNHRPRLETWPLKRIASVEFTSSILESWLALNVVDGGKMRRVTMVLPNTTTSFRMCFTALRQQLVAVPVG